MAFVLNASAELVEFKVYGSHFTMKPGQSKFFSENFARFISLNDTTKNLGLVVLPETLDDMEYQQSKEGKDLIEQKRKEGIEARVRHLRDIIHNNQVALRQDLDRMNIKADPKAYASDGEIKAYEELIKYQAKKADEEKKKIDRLKDLEAQLKEI